jgi:hypothetical protein
VLDELSRHLLDLDKDVRRKVLRAFRAMLSDGV